MYRQIWRQVHPSIAQLSFYTQDKINTISLTGFKVRNYLVTDEHVRNISHYDHVEIRFVGKDGMTTTVSRKLSKMEFEKRVVVGLNDKIQNIVLIKLDFPEFKSIPSLRLCEECHTEIGEPLATMGFKLNQQNLAIKQGILSSYYTNDGIRYLQIDCSIKHGNAGSPVIRAETGEVIGIIGYKLTEISHSYKKLKDIMNNNLQLLKRYQGRYNMDDIDPVQVLIANQNQIKYITKEIYRTTSMGVGYALPSKQIVNFFKENLIMEGFHKSKDMIAGF